MIRRLLYFNAQTLNGNLKDENSSCMREMETIACFGGDEFVVLFSNHEII
ncbi:MAG: hypothetical protein JW902_10145 [Syntrophaceae bacterium]|nr:hypothetical protein [Syntrophaceae bacterium]